MKLVKGVNSADLCIYVSNTHGNPTKERCEKHAHYNNLKDNSKVTSISFFNEVIKPVEPAKVVTLNEGAAKEKEEEVGEVDGEVHKSVP